jgi:hypothetical protein
LADRFKRIFHDSRYVCKKNYPYRGYTDGICSILRKQFSGDKYLGFELEVNQSHFNGKCFSTELKDYIYYALYSFLANVVSQFPQSEV